MGFWKQKGVRWKSESCYVVCTTGTETLYATKGDVGRWFEGDPANARKIDNNPNQAVFPGGGKVLTEQPKPAADPPDAEAKAVAIEEFREETGLQIVENKGLFDIVKGDKVLATAVKATIYHGKGFHALILLFKETGDLNKIAAAINEIIKADDVLYTPEPHPKGVYGRSDDELKSVTVGDSKTDWQKLFGGDGQDWFLDIMKANAIKW